MPNSPADKTELISTFLIDAELTDPVLAARPPPWLVAILTDELCPLLSFDLITTEEDEKFDETLIVRARNPFGMSRTK